MSRLRLLLFCLLALAVPLQGFAAATQLFCGAAASAHAPAAQPAPAHDHAAGGHAHGHATDATEAAAASSQEAAPAHDCGLCAACCHGIGVASDAQRGDPRVGAAVAAAEPARSFPSRVTRVPDKPPRG